jgi:hypothetical protein
MASMALATPQRLNLTQPLDHTNPMDQVTIPQLYILDEDNYNGNNVMFLYTGGESDIDYYWNSSGGTFREWGAQSNALVVFAEHRFYGTSFPQQADDVSLYRGLTLENVIADMIALIKHLNQQYKTQFRVVTAGGSWAGELAAYVRLRGAQMGVVAAVASSAPFGMMGYRPHTIGPNPTNDIPMDFEYYRRVESVIYQLNPQCASVTTKAMEQLKSMAVAKNFVGIQQSLKLCSTPTANDMNQIYFWIRDAFAGLVQSNHPNNDPKRSWPAVQACDAMRPYFTADPIEALVKSFIEASYGPADDNMDQVGCYVADTDDFSTLVSSHYRSTTQHRRPRFTPITTSNRQGRVHPPVLAKDDLTWDENSSWFVQMCFYSNYGQASGQYSPYKMFPQLLDGNFYESCEKFLKADTSRGAEKLSVDYPRTAQQWLASTSNIIFSSGNWDPWGCAGIRNSLSDDLIAINIPHAAHHLDLNFKTNNDTQIIQQARSLEYQIIKEFIKPEGPNREALKSLRAQADKQFPDVDCPSNLW